MSNKKCCVPGCPHSTGSIEPLHKFPNPAKNKELFNQWLYSIGGDILALDNEHIFKHRRVCHIHFEPKYVCRYNRISNVAVPTKNMPGLSTLKFTFDERTPLRPIQHASEPSTSKGPVPPLPSQSAEEDVILEMKENLRPVTASPHQKTATLPLHSQSAVEDAQIKENREPVTMTSHPKSVALSLHTQSQSATEHVQIKKNLERRKTESSRNITKTTSRKRVATTSAEQALYRKLVQVGVKLSKCRSKIKKQAVKIKAMKNITNNPEFLKILNRLPSTAKILTMLQFRELKKGKKGRRFTLEEKIVALSILKQSPKGYRFLRKIFILPSPQTLIKLVNMADIRPGINKNIMQQIKKATEKITLQDRLCVVLFDEMSLKASVTYNERKDRVSGFVTNGQETYPEFADHAQVFMIRGLLKNYKQPVAYTFSQAATKGPELAKQLKSVISELQKAGLIVVATVCDQGTNNTQCIKLLMQEARATLLRKGEEPRENVLLINDQEIIPLYDPPHLLKCIRNNLISKDLQYTKDNETKTAKWFHITCLHNENPGYKGIRLIPKLTDNHCIPSKIPRMKVKYASQIFSQTVATNMGYLADKGILPNESKETADILLFFDELFDSVNGSFGKRKKHGKPLLGPVTPSSEHHKVWEESKKVLKDMKFVKPDTSQVDYVPTLKNWVCTLDGIQLLVKNLEKKYNVTSVWLRHLNQDPIENFFGSIRSHGCRNVNPTPERFESAFTSLMINSLSSVHAAGANCEADDCYALHEVIITSGDCKEPRSSDLEGISEITITPLEDKNDPRQIGGLQYVSGYFVKSAKRQVFKGCNQCKDDLISQNESEYLLCREYAKKKWLYSPSDSLLCCISSLQDINYTILKENLEKDNLKELIKTFILMTIEFDFIKCEIHKDQLIDYLLKISCRFFIYNYCKDLNKILCNKRECDDDDDVFKVKAKKLSLKCFKRKI